MSDIHKNRFSHADTLRIVLPVVLTLVLFFMTIFMVILPFLESSIMERKRETARDLTRSARSSLESFASKEMSGQLSREEAQTKALEHVRGLRYGPDLKDYFWINDMHPRMIMHPYRPDLEGKDLSSFTDPNGKRLFVEFVQTVQNAGGGFVDYMWQWKDDPSRIVPKISYVTGFEPWGWIIGTGIYIEDVLTEFSSIKKKLTWTCSGVLAIVVLLSLYVIWQGLRAEKERQESGQALREGEETLSQIIAGSSAPTFVLDRNHTVTHWNRACAGLTGLPADELIGTKRQWSPFYSEARPVMADLILENAAQEEMKREFGETCRRSAITEGGYEREAFFPGLGESGKWLFVSAVPLRDAKGEITGAIETLQDITEAKRAEEEFRSSEEKMRLIIESSPIGIRINQHGRYLYVNPALIKMFGYASPEEIVGLPVEALYAPEDREMIRERQRKRLAAESIPLSYEITGLRKTGERFNVAIWLTKIDYQGAPAILGFVIDTTLERTLRAQLQQAQKMEAIGTLAGGIAHDFNNILAAIVGYSEMAMYNNLPKESKAHTNMGQVLKAAHRAKDLVMQILTFSRQSEQERRPVKVHLIVKEALKLLRASLPSTIEIRTHIEEDSDSVMADPTQVHQVLMNLCTNAHHAMLERGGVLEVSLVPVEMDRADAAEYHDLEPGHYLKLSVSDTGHGMDRNTMERIFDPYFTTKEKGSGTGLGLAVVHGIVKSHGGKILVESELGVETAFHVFIPRILSESEPKAEIHKPLPRGGERILFIDDEEFLVDLGKQMLERLGYTVECMTGSMEALDAFGKRPDDFDLVITDMTMPKMTGEVLAKRLMSIRPDIPIIISTGFSELMSEERAREIGIISLIMKPLSIRDLAKTIRSALDGHKPA
jgi:PAS domain S-box-containing protein